MSDFLGTTRYPMAETQYFTNAEAFLETLRTHLRTSNTTGFEYNIVFADAPTLKAVDDLIDKMRGEINPHLVDHYLGNEKCHMTDEDKNQVLNSALYKKAFAEQEDYRAWLLSQSPEEILNHTYEYTIRADILLALESNDLENEQAAALLGFHGPLYEVYRDFERLKTDHMETILDCITERADTLIERQAEEKLIKQHPSVRSMLQAAPSEQGEKRASAPIRKGQER